MKMPIWVITNNTYIHKAGEALVVEIRRNGIYYSKRKRGSGIPCPGESISYIEKYGNSQISEQVLNFCAEKKIPIFRFSYGNRYGGMFLPPESCVGKIRLKQYEHYFDNNKRLFLAKEFVRQAAQNKRVVLQKHYYKDKNILIKQAAEKIKSLIKKINSAENIESLRGIEGGIANTYFDGLKKCVKYYKFTTREYNPPKDEVNCLLSFCYALLYSEITARLYEHGFDIFIGYLHEQNNDSRAIVYDLSEVFKQKVDLFILELINKNQIKKEFFNKKEDGSCLLDTYGKNFVLKKWIALLRETKFDEALDKPTSWTETIRKEIIKLKHHLEDGINYEGFRL